MGMFTWQDQYNIGDTLVDAQHQQVFDLANRIVEARDTNEITRLVMLFYKHIREHFKAEEVLMKQNSYPDYSKHVEAHDQMLDMLNELSKTVHSEQVTSSDIQAFVEHWLLMHIVEMDMAFGDFLKQHGQT